MRTAIANVFGAEFHRVENREHLGKPAVVAVAIRIYDTTVEDLWEAVTAPERIARWFLPVEGDLKLGGRYQLKGNAGGTITRCEPPEALDLTWEIMGGTSWVNLRLAPEGRKRGSPWSTSRTRKGSAKSTSRSSVRAPWGSGGISGSTASNGTCSIRQFRSTPRRSRRGRSRRGKGVPARER